MAPSALAAVRSSFSASFRTYLVYVRAGAVTCASCALSSAGGAVTVGADTGAAASFTISGSSATLTSTAVNVAAQGTLTVPASSTVAIVRCAVPLQCLIAIEQNGNSVIRGSGQAQVAGTLNVQAGAQLAMQGKVVVSSGGQVSAGASGALAVNGGGTLEIQSGGTCQSAGGSVTIGADSGAAGTLLCTGSAASPSQIAAATVTVAATGVVNVLAGSQAVLVSAAPERCCFLIAVAWNRLARPRLKALVLSTLVASSARSRL